MIKTFKFRVSNGASYIQPEDINSKWYREQTEDLWSLEQIDEAINTWINDNKFIIEQIEIAPVEINKHNNARGNTVDLYYIVKYR